MENAVEALKMAAAILIFIGALSLAIFGLTKASQAANKILSKEDVQYYDTENIKILENRIVGIETVIPTLYSYFKEDYTILFYTGSVDGDGELSGSISPLTLYYSEALPEKLSLSMLRNENDNVVVDTYNNNRLSRAIYGIDKDDEDTRKEPWLNDEIHTKYFIKSLVNNIPDDYKWPWSRKLVNSSPNSLDDEKKELTLNFDSAGTLTNRLGKSLAQSTNARFVERIGVYNEKMSTDEGNTTTQTDTSGSVIEFSNNEVIENEEGTQKRVIQYIYIGNR